jgi:hypothetical protein
MSLDDLTWLVVGLWLREILRQSLRAAARAHLDYIRWRTRRQRHLARLRSAKDARRR